MDIGYFKKEKITAMKEHNKDAISALNVLINKIMMATIDKRAKEQEITEGDIVSLVQKTEKELIEERDAFEKAGRTDSVASLNTQIETIKKYIPKMMSADEIKAVIMTLDDKSVPSVMRKFKTDYAGKCEMRTVNEVLKSLK